MVSFQSAEGCETDSDCDAKCGNGNGHCMGGACYCYAVIPKQKKNHLQGQRTCVTVDDCT